MGQSHIDSNIIAKDGTEYIASFAAVKNVTTLSGTNGVFTTSNQTTASANYLKASGLGDTGYIQIGLTQRIFVGNSNTEAAVIADATALVGTPIKGSMYMSRGGELWFFTSDTTASPAIAN